MAHSLALIVEMEKGYLPPWLLQILGSLILVGATVYWATSGHQSALIIGAAIALIGLGAYSGIRISISQAIDQDKKEIQRRSKEIAHEVEDIDSS